MGSCELVSEFMQRVGSIGTTGRFYKRFRRCCIDYYILSMMHTYTHTHKKKAEYLQLALLADSFER